MSTNIPAQRVQGSKSIEDLERQVNIALGRVNAQLRVKGAVTGITAAAFAAQQAQINSLLALSGADINNGGTGNPAPTPASQSVTVTTDGVTISGDGDNSPIALIEPVVFKVRATSTSPDTVTATDVFVLASASAGADIVENLPAAAATGRILIFKKMDANAHNVAVTPNGSDTIDGVNAAVNISIQYSTLRLVDGAAGTWQTW